MNPDVIKHLRIELATAFCIALNARFHGWMATGPHAQDCRRRFAGIREGAEADQEALGERIRILGGIPVHSPLQLHELSVVDSREPTTHPLEARALLQEALDAQERMVGLIRQGIELSALVSDAGTASLLSGLLRCHEREAWILDGLLI